MPGSGRVVNVTEHTAGSELAEAPYAGALWPSDSLWPSEALWPSAATQLSVVDPIDFDADGGHVTLVDVDGNEETVAYVFPDENQDVLDLLTSLSGTYAEGDPVYLTDQNGRRYVERWADVLQPQAEEVLRIRVPHALYALLPPGIREEGTEEQVTFAQDGTDEVVADVLGKEPAYDATGHFYAASGIDIDAGTSTTPPDDNRIRWIRQSDEAVIAELVTYSSSADVIKAIAHQQSGESGFVQIGAQRPDEFISTMICRVFEGGGATEQWIQVAVPDDAGGTVSKYLLRGDGFSDFEFDESGGWQSWTPTLTGWSANPTSGVYRYKQTGDEVHVQINQPNNGTSNATTKSVSLPVTAATITNIRWEGLASAVDNGVALTTAARGRVASAGTVIDFDMNMGSAGGWTASGSHRIVACHLVYEAAP